MRALTVEPRTAGSVRVEVIDDPIGAHDDMVVESLLVGLCGTDAEIVAGHYGAPPPGERRLVLGHEALGRVTVPPADGTFAEGDLVVPMVRRPDPVPCTSCAAGDWDMCRNGQYTEHGIKEADGFARAWYGLEPSRAVSIPPQLGELGVLVEPASVMAKAWEHIEHIGRRGTWEPTSVVVTGPGPIGLLAALLAVQRGCEVHVIGLSTEGPKPAIVADLGAHYHATSISEACPAPDIVVECTGVGSVVVEAIRATGPAGIVCLVGLSSGGRTVELDPADVNRRLVLENDVVFGSVNANRRHYEAAVDALSRADQNWLARLITRREPLDNWEDAIRKRPDDIKVVLEPGAGA